jgi:hypothetical protein
MDASPRTRGHLVVLRAPEAFRVALARAASGVDRAGYEAYVRALWAALPTLAPADYRGVDRDPLEPIFETGVQTTPGVGPDWVAKVRMREGLRPASGDPAFWRDLDPDLIDDLALARDVLRQTDRPSEREVIVVQRDAAEAGSRTLGFDVASWGGDHLSLVRSVLLVPGAHGAPREEFDALRPHARRLNESRLFATRRDAEAYRAWVLSRPWAERDRGDDPAGRFHAIRVDEVPPA